MKHYRFYEKNGGKYFETWDQLRLFGHTFVFHKYTKLFGLVDRYYEKPPTNDNDGVFRVAKNGRVTLGNNEIPFVTKYDVLNDVGAARPIVTLTLVPSNVEIKRYEFWD